MGHNMKTTWIVIGCKYRLMKSIYRLLVSVYLCFWCCAYCWSCCRLYIVLSTNDIWRQIKLNVNVKIKIAKAFFKLLLSFIRAYSNASLPIITPNSLPPVSAWVGPTYIWRSKSATKWPLFIRKMKPKLDCFVMQQIK